MTFLPVIERELRVASRKRGTFWMRVIAALVAVVIGVGFMIIMRIAGSGVSGLGDALFSVLSWFALVGALSAGLFFTADCLSEEKREGTLGFLFLTDLKGYDVAGGKMAVSSLRVSFALLAIFPVLAVTVLLGSVGGAQIFKTLLALMNALFVSLAAGLFVSSLSREAQKALAGTLFLMLLLIFGGSAADRAMAWARNGRYLTVFTLASPGFVFTQAQAWGRSEFWPALGVTQAIGWICLALASWLAPRTWQEKPKRRTVGTSQDWWRYGSTARRARLRAKLLSVNPIEWLALRECWQTVVAWGIVAVEAAGLLLLAWAQVPPAFWVVWSGLQSVAALIFYVWIASQACRLFVDTRRSGFLSCVLGTPFPLGSVITGQWRALCRMFGPPATAYLVLQLLSAVMVGRATAQMTAAFTPPPMVTTTTVNSNGVTTTTVTTNVTTVAMPPAAAAMLKTARMVVIVSVITKTIGSVGTFAALAWVGMWMGMTSKNNGLALLKTLVFVIVVPSMVIGFVASFVSFLVILPNIARLMAKASVAGGPGGAAAGSAMSSSMMLMPLVSAGVSLLLMLAVDGWLIYYARRRLLASLREEAGRPGLEPAPLTPLPPFPPPVAPIQAG